jgi:hypothetical protein
VSELDRLREQIAYLKYVQGVFVVTQVSLAGWLLSGSDERTYLSTLALLAIVVLSFAILGLHRQIERCIERIGSL